MGQQKICMVAMIIVGVLLVADAAPVAAQEPGLVRNVITTFRPPSSEEQRSIAANLGLDDDQKVAMKELNERYRGQSQSLLARYQQAYADVLALMETTQVDKGTVDARLRSFHSIHAEIVEVEISYWLEFKRILTPEQNRRFWNLFEQSRVR